MNINDLLDGLLKEGWSLILVIAMFFFYGIVRIILNYKKKETSSQQEEEINWEEAIKKADDEIFSYKDEPT